MNTWGEKGECFFHKYFSKFKIIGSYTISFIDDKYLIVKIRIKNPSNH